MTRLRADLLLLLTAMIWGGGFIAQKPVSGGIGPFGFNGARFVLAFLVILPFVIREAKGRAGLTKRDIGGSIILGLFFIGGVMLQQTGIPHTTVTNAGFFDRALCRDGAGGGVGVFSQATVFDYCGGVADRPGGRDAAGRATGVGRMDRSAAP